MFLKTEILKIRQNFPRKLSELPQNDHFKNGQKMHQYWSQNPEIKIFDFRMTIHEGYSYFCPAVYAFCILKFSLQPILAPKKIGQKWPFSAKFRPNFFGPNLAEMKILLCKRHMATKIYIFFFIHYWKFLLYHCLSPRIGGFVNLFFLICMKHFHFTIFEYPRVYSFQKI